MKLLMKYTGLILLLFTLTTCKKKTTVKVKVYNYALDEPIANATVAMVEKKGESGGGIFGGGAKCHEIASLLNSNLDNLYDNKAYLFPNPNDGAFTLMTRNELIDVTVQVSSEIGTVLYTKHFESLSKIDLNFDLKPGIYFVNLISGTKNIKPVKFVVY